MFVELTYQGVLISVNIELITKYAPRGLVTCIWLLNGEMIAVEENYDEVRNLINEAISAFYCSGIGEIN